MAIKPIQILINAKDNASAVFGSLQAKVAAVGAAIAGFFTVRAFTGAVRGAAELQAKLSEVQAVSGATADELEAMRAAAESAGATTKFTATEAADALGNLARSGLNAKSAIAALPSTLALAQAGNLSLADSSSIMTRALAGFGLEAEQAGRVADVLAKGANSANTTVTGLGQALSFAAPTAVSLGLSLEDTVAIIGKFADAGIDAGRAGTALNSILAQFSDPASKFRKELAAAGITTGDFNTALAQLGSAGPRGQKAILAVGQEAGPALRALLNQGIGSLDELRTALLGAQGAAAATAATMDNNLQGATRGLASAWDTVKNALTTPVLPVLQQGVTQLADALRKAVSDGVVGRFGEALARGFQVALQAFKSFIGQIDFEAVGRRLEDLVGSAGRAFESLAQYATNAGNSVKLAWGVMATGSNVVLSGIYRVGEAFAGVASNIVGWAGQISVAWSKIGFGETARRMEEEGKQLIEMSKGLWAASEALAQRAQDALRSAGQSAGVAADGFRGLIGVVDKSAQSSYDAATGLGSVARELERLADANAKAREETEKTAAKQQDQDRAARVASAAVVKLRQEYAELIAKGDLQAAAEKFEAINVALSKTPEAGNTAASVAKATAEEVKAAFERMGFSTKEALIDAANSARRDFEIMKASGQGTADVLQAAYRKAAEAAIASGDQAQQAWVRATAAARGFEVTVDSAGRTIVRSMADAKGATDQLGDAAGSAAGQFRRLASAAEGAAAAALQVAEINRRFSRPGEGSTDRKDPGRGSPYARPQDKKPVNADGQTQEEYLRAEKLKGQNAVDNTLIFALRDKLAAGTLTSEDARDLANAIAALDQNEQVNRDLDRLNPAAFSLEGAADRNEWRNVRQLFEQALARLQGGAGVPQKGAAAVGKTVNINLQLNGDSYGTVDTSPGGSDNLERFLRELERDRRRGA